MSVLAVDIGGTKVSAALVDASMEIIHSVVLPTRAAEGYAVSLAQVHEAIRGCWSGKVEGIGVCAPGPLQPDAGIVFSPPNLPGWRNIPLAADLSQAFGVPCRIENDANAAGLAEARFGAGRGYASVFYVTLSTGIGTGIILDGNVYHGSNGLAGEGGHVSVDYSSQMICNCGLPGCIEAFASGSAIARRAGVPGEIVGRAVAEGDPLACAILDEICMPLATWLGGIVNLLDPGVIVIGGGVSQIGEPLFTRLRRLVPERSINQFAHETPIVPAQLGANAGLLGAAALILSGNHR